MALERLIELKDEMHKCFRCNLCKMIPLPVVRNSDFFDGCPANREYAFHSYSGSGKQIMALSLVEGRIQADEKLSEIVYACTTCGSCDVACKFNMEAERTQVNMALREHIVDSGLELPVHREMVDNLVNHGYPGEKPPNAPGDWAKGLGLKILPKEKAQVLLFAGCLQRKDSALADTARKLALLLVSAGVDVGILDNAEPSCGLPAYWTGFREIFTQKAMDNTTLLDKLGVETIITVSGSCLGAFRSKYPEYAKAPAPKVVHATEFLWELIKKKKLSLPRSVRQKVTYHDPCYLGRQSEPPINWEGESRLTRGQMTYNVPAKPVNKGVNGVYDAPRNILKAINGLDFTEMYRIREYSFCCGGGGGVPQAYPEMGRATALHRIDEARTVGAQSLVTACHACRMHLSGDGQSNEKNPMPITDIVDLVFEASGI